jgi:hypothetical protein
VAGLREFTVPTNVANNMNTRFKRIWWYPYDAPSEATLRALGKVFGGRDGATRRDGLRALAKNMGRALKQKL